MDPVTHTFVGASLAAAGLRRTTPLAATTLIVAANAPDVDIVAQAWGSYTALAFRRGLTHGLPAMIVLPLLVAGAVMAWDRWIRRRRRPEADPVRPRAVLGLAALGVWTHPFLDWLNNYGMRWLMPLDPSWSYGDALFIIDPWVWLLLGGSLFLVHSASVHGRVLWGLLAAAMSVVTLGTGMAPGPVQAIWVGGLVGWILLRIGLGERARGRPGERASRWALGAVAVYILAMVIQTPLSERVVEAQALELGLDPIYDVMVAPVPALPHRGQVVVVTPEAYHTGAFSWTGSPRLVLEGPPLERDYGDPVVAAAREHPDARSFLVWSRYPWYRAHPDGDGWRVEIRDVRYLGRGDAGGLMGLTVYLDRNLELR